MDELIEMWDVETRTPDLTPDEQQQLHAELNAAGRRVAPCLAADVLTADQAVEARGILLRAIDRAGAVEAWVESVSTGPYGTKFRASAGTSSILTSADEAALRALCGGTSDALAPLGSFPAAGPYDRLFASLGALP